MNQNIYLKLERNNEVRDRSVTIGDVGKIYCSDNAVVSKLKTVKVMTVPKTEKGGKYGFIFAKTIQMQMKQYKRREIWEYFN